MVTKVYRLLIFPIQEWEVTGNDVGLGRVCGPNPSQRCEGWGTRTLVVPDNCEIQGSFTAFRMTA